MIESDPLYIDQIEHTQIHPVLIIEHGKNTLYRMIPFMRMVKITIENKHNRKPQFT